MFKMLRKLLAMMGKQRKEIIASMVLSSFDGILLATPIIIAFLMVKRIVEQEIHAGHIFCSALIMLASILLRIVMRYYTLRLRSGAGYLAMSEERKRLGEDLKNISMGYFTKKNLGDLVTAITSDAGFIEIEGMGIVEKMGVGIPTFFVGIILIMGFDYRIGTMVAGLFVPTFFVYRLLSGVQKRHNLDRQNQIALFADEVVDFIKGIEVLKIYNMTESQFFKIKHAFAKVRELSFKIELYHIPSSALYSFCFRCISFAIILLTGLYTISGELNFSTSFILMLSALTIFGGIEIMGIYGIFSRLTMSSMNRIKNIRKIPKMNNDGVAKVKAHGIAFDKVSFGYDEREVLTDISFVAKEQTSTALVGLSGSGKTTIINLISRFWDVDRGSIRIGGVDVRDLDYEDLLQHISFVFQDVFLFDDTVLNNIRLARADATMEEVMEAAKKARCHDFIMALDQGYNTIIGENGSKLSGGEKQRLSIARALIKNAPIVLLDEVTANVDVENEWHIKLALQELLQDKTVILIAHQLSTIVDVDKILVIEDGRVIQQGTHHDLVKEKGRYKQLWDLQYKASTWRL
ncbi:MAG: ABC transporter ATP-binding protein [Tissierellia bacterium]|nr:ABC transporter ATP-binding protein [Tissierellia bacterium]